jgi:hypothetical protein
MRGLATATNDGDLSSFGHARFTRGAGRARVVLMVPGIPA